MSRSARRHAYEVADRIDQADGWSQA
jgi:hypothetical protein